jgi:hypothetical protein
LLGSSCVEDFELYLEVSVNITVESGIIRARQDFHPTEMLDIAGSGDGLLVTTEMVRTQVNSPSTSIVFLYSSIHDKF